jgi:transposase-like protein
MNHDYGKDYKEYNEYENSNNYERQMQVQLDKQKQQMYLDYKDVSDTLLSLLSTAEVIALQDSNKKELGYYDEYDTAKRKAKNSQIIQFLRLLRQYNGMQKDFIKLYENYELPNNLTLDYILNRIKYWKSFIKDKTLSSYYDEILNILKGKTTINVNLELNKYYDKNLKLNEEQQAKRWDNVIGIKHLCLEEDKQVIDEILKTGRYTYQVKFNKKAGRNIGLLVNKSNKQDFFEVY